MRSAPVCRFTFLLLSSGILALAARPAEGGYVLQGDIRGGVRADVFGPTGLVDSEFLAGPVPQELDTTMTGPGNAVVGVYGLADGYSGFNSAAVGFGFGLSLEGDSGGAPVSVELRTDASMVNSVVRTSPQVHTAYFWEFAPPALKGHLEAGDQITLDVRATLSRGASFAPVHEYAVSRSYTTAGDFEDQLPSFHIFLGQDDDMFFKFGNVVVSQMTSRFQIFRAPGSSGRASIGLDPYFVTDAVEISAVPEPSTLAMAVPAVLFGLAYGWRRRKRVA